MKNLYKSIQLPKALKILSLLVIASLIYIQWKTKPSDFEKKLARFNSDAVLDNGAESEGPATELTGEARVQELITQVEEEILADLNEKNKSGALEPDMYLKMLRFSIPDEQIALKYKIEKGDQNGFILSGTIKNPSSRFTIFRAVFDLKIKDCINASCNQIVHTGLYTNQPVQRGSESNFQVLLDVDPNLVQGVPKADLLLAANWAYLDPQTIAEEEAEMAQDDDSTPE